MYSLRDHGSQGNDLISFPFPVPDTSNVQKRPADMIFPQRIPLMQKHICVTCGRKVEGLKDELSQKEYLISGMCQRCQDEVFGSEPE